MTDFVEIYKDLCRQHFKPIQEIDWNAIESTKWAGEPGILDFSDPNIWSMEYKVSNPCDEKPISSWQFQSTNIIDPRFSLKIENTK
jgi:hypothetical protein